MKHLLLLHSLFLAVLLPMAFVVAQTSGDYGSAGTGNWGTTGANWLVYGSNPDWSDATPASGPPTSSTNVWIRSGHTVTVEASGKTFNNLTVQTGATLAGANLLPTSSLRYLRIYGSTLTNNGTIGSPTDVLGLSLFGGSGQVVTVTGSGTTYFSRIQQNSTGTSIVFDMDVQLDYAGSSGSGSTALYPSTAGNSFAVTVNAGKTLTMVPFAYISAHTSSGSSAGASPLTIDVYGTIVTQANAIINLNNTSPNNSILTVHPGGVINLGSVLRANTGTGGVTVTVNNGGRINGLASSTFDLSLATMTIDGTVDFGSSVTGTRSLGTATVGSTGVLKVSDGTFPAGTITLNDGATVEYYGTGAITLPSSPTTYSNLTINNSAGVTLSASTTVNGALTFSAGKLLLGSNDLTIGAFGSIAGSDAAKYVVTDGTGALTRNGIGASTVLFPVGPATSYNPVTINNAGTADAFSVRVQTTFDNPPYLPNSVVNRQWTITEANTGGSNATITLQWNAADQASGFSPASAVYLGRYTGTQWVQTAATVSGSDPYTATASGFDTFSPFSVGNDGALPIQLASFSAVALNASSVRVQWVTISEINNYGFEVQKSLERTAGFVTVSGLIPGHGTTNQRHEYSFVDQNAAPGRWFYRLKQIDLDGTQHFFEPVVLDVLTSVAEVAPKVFMLEQNYPNPFNPTTTITFSVAQTGPAALRVFDVLGREVMTVFHAVAEAGKNYAMTVDATGMPSGLYFYRLESNGMTAVRKMLLTK